MRKQRTLTILLGSMIIVGGFSSCASEGNNPGVEYAPNMYVSEAYEAFTQTEMMEYNPNGMTMRLPVEGTIARGQMEYSQYSEGYEESSAWSNPVRPTEASMAESEALYLTYCSHCHGKTGKNDGAVVKNSEYPPPPFANYQTEYIQNLPDGKIYHTITFGKGLMGSHATQLSPKERWQVTNYVKYLSNKDAFEYADEQDASSEAGDANSGGSGGFDLSIQSKGIPGFEMSEVDPQKYMSLARAMNQVQFANLRAKIKDESYPLIDKVANYLLENEGQNILLGGHTGRDLGMDAAQGELALKRAQAVQDYLVEKGVSADRVKVKSFGSDLPIASNDSEEGRNTNRRVDIYFVQ